MNGSYILDFSINSSIVGLASMLPCARRGQSSVPVNSSLAGREDPETQIQSLDVGVEASGARWGGKTMGRSRLRVAGVRGGRGGGDSVMRRGGWLQQPQQSSGM